MGYSRYVEYGTGRRGPGTLELKLPEHEFKRVISETLCRSSHPLAIFIGTVSADQPCCWHCQIVHPTAGTFPG